MVWATVIVACVIVSAFLILVLHEGRHSINDDTSVKDSSDNSPLHREGDLIYLFDDHDDEICVIGYSGEEEILEIPSSIDGHQVTSVGHYDDITFDAEKIIIPDSVRTIGDRVF